MIEKENAARGGTLETQASVGSGNKGNAFFGNNNLFVDSFEAERLKELISSKKKYLQKQTNPIAAQFSQKEILLLEKDVLPIVQANTAIVPYECAKYFIEGLHRAIDLKCNGVLFYIPLHNEYEKRPIVAVINEKEFCPLGTPGAVSIDVTNMDGNGVAVEPINVHLR
ncbi:MAG: hypothetical protein MdMp024_1742 [Bacteroidales bacterium]